MSTVCVVAPPNWLPLVQALEAAGHTCVSLLGDAPSPNAFDAVQRIMVEGHIFESALELAAPAALIDLNKTVRAVGVPDPVRTQFAAFRQHLSTAYGVRRFVEEAIARNGATAVVVVCTYDVPGRAALGCVVVPAGELRRLRGIEAAARAYLRALRRRYSYADEREAKGALEAALEDGT